MNGYAAKEISGLSDEAFASTVKGLIAQKQQIDKTLGAESVREKPRQCLPLRVVNFVHERPFVKSIVFDQTVGARLRGHTGRPPRLTYSGRWAQHLLKSACSRAMFALKKVVVQDKTRMQKELN